MVYFGLFWNGLFSEKRPFRKETIPKSDHSKETIPKFKRAHLNEATRAAAGELTGVANSLLSTPCIRTLCFLWAPVVQGSEIALGVKISARGGSGDPESNFRRGQNNGLGRGGGLEGPKTTRIGTYAYFGTEINRK